LNNNDKFDIILICTVGVRNISIYPLRNHYFIKLEESVKCSAEGNPTPTCSWYNILAKETTGDMLHITASMNETVQFYQCQCSNDIGSTAKNFLFNVTGKNKRIVCLYYDI